MPRTDENGRQLKALLDYLLDGEIDAKDLFDKPAAALTKALGGATLAANQPLQSGAQIELMPTETA